VFLWALLPEIKWMMMMMMMMMMIKHKPGHSASWWLNYNVISKTLHSREQLKLETSNFVRIHMAIGAIIENMQINSDGVKRWDYVTSFEFWGPLVYLILDPI